MKRVWHSQENTRRLEKGNWEKKKKNQDTKALLGSSQNWQNFATLMIQFLRNKGFRRNKTDLARTLLLLVDQRYFFNDSIDSLLLFIFKTSYDVSFTWN